MKSFKKNIEILHPKNQLNLFGYNIYFDLFTKLYETKKLPNSILLSGSKGSGKSTFAYHFANYLLSKNEQDEYLIRNFTINKENLSYKYICNDTHPNFFLIENKIDEKEIKIDKIRSLKRFLGKSTYSRNLKIVLIDNAEYLNINSANALLKSIEEPSENTFFFIIHDNTSPLLETIQSRCIEFKIFQSTHEKKSIFTNIVQYYKNQFEFDDVLNDLYFDSPGNLLKYYLILDDAKINFNEDFLPSILYFIEKYKNDKNEETLSFLLLFIHKFYKKLYFEKKENIIFFNHLKIFRQIHYMKKFNLSEKNILIWLKNILINEKR